MSVASLRPVPQTDTSHIPAIAAGLRATFATGRTKSLEWRQAQLRGLAALLTQEEPRLFAALRADLGKGEFEAFAGEVGQVLAEVGLASKKLPSWSAAQRVSTPLPHQPGKSYVVPEPLGVVLVIAPWNYPLQLSLNPLVGALAAGNCAVLKPSEVAPHTSATLAELLPKYLDPEAVAVIEGGVEETTALLALKWDHVFYTGNGYVGRIVMRAAAEHLTPVTLELGGKSPTLVDTSVDLTLAARRVAWGKFFNAGQTCTAPDYVLVSGGRRDAFVQAVRESVEAFYGDDPRTSPDYGRIVNERHVRRLQGLLDEGEVAFGGQVDLATRYIAPTVVVEPRLDGKLMQDEIFGPILPVLEVESMDEAVRFVAERPKPLALYLFSEDAEVQRRVMQGTSAGGTCFNDTLSHVAIPTMPFGGVGESGMGAYHGKASFDTFSHRRALFKRATWMDIKLRYPPYGDRLGLIRRLL